jgi:hypothetical protein
MAPQKKNGLEAGEGGLSKGGCLAVHRLRALPRARQGQNEHTQHANNRHHPVGLSQALSSATVEKICKRPTTNALTALFQKGKKNFLRLLFLP